MKACVLLVAAGLLAAKGGLAAEPVDERARIQDERRALESHFTAEQAQCQTRFAVTGCVEAVKSRRREALNGLRQQELLLDDAERRRRAAERMQTIERKRIEAESRPPASAPASLPPAVPRHPTPAASAPAHAPSKPQGEEARAAARRAAAAEKRREAAVAEQAKIAERQAQRAQSGKKMLPLPMPPAASMSGR